MPKIAYCRNGLYATKFKITIITWATISIRSMSTYVFAFEVEGYTAGPRHIDINISNKEYIKSSL